MHVPHVVKHGVVSSAYFVISPSQACEKASQMSPPRVIPSDVTTYRVWIVQPCRPGSLELIRRGRERIELEQDYEISDLLTGTPHAAVTRRTRGVETGIFFAPNAG